MKNAVIKITILVTFLVFGGLIMAAHDSIEFISVLCHHVIHKSNKMEIVFQQQFLKTVSQI